MLHLESYLHLGHLELLSLGNGVNLILLAPALSLTLGLGNQPQSVLTASGLFLKGATGTVQLVLQVPVKSESGQYKKENAAQEMRSGLC